jgi:hypothetical protein
VDKITPLAFAPHAPRAFLLRKSTLNKRRLPRVCRSRGLGMRERRIVQAASLPGFLMFRRRECRTSRSVPPVIFQTATRSRCGAVRRLERVNFETQLPIASLFLRGAAFTVQMMRRRIALDPDVGHGLRAELDRPACQDPSSVARLAPGAARDEVNVARPTLHSPNLLVGADGSDRADECDSRENSQS